MKNYPVLGVGAVVIYKSKVLLVQRSAPPFTGQWCIPGGKVRFGETLQQAAEREILEETGIVIKAGEPVYCFDIIDTDNSEFPLHYVVIDLEAVYVSGDIKPASDAQDCAWFGKDEIMRDDVQQLTQQFLQRWWIES
jgi:ADP-ribose pyrophosphatase